MRNTSFQSTLKSDEALYTTISQTCLQKYCKISDWCQS